MRHRSNRSNRQYAAIPNAAMRDEHLSIEARGLLALLMTYADNWTFRRDHLMRMAGVGKDKLGRLMRELIEAGYVAHDYLHDERGRMIGRTWMINDQPRPTVVRKEPTTDTVVRENRGPENPSSGEPASIRKPKLKNTNSQVLTNRPNYEFSENWRPDPEVIAWALKEGFTEREIETEIRKWVKHWRDKGLRPAHPLGKSFKGWLTLEIKRRSQHAKNKSPRQQPSILDQIKREEAETARKDQRIKPTNRCEDHPRVRA